MRVEIESSNRREEMTASNGAFWGVSQGGRADGWKQSKRRRRFICLSAFRRRLPKTEVVFGPPVANQPGGMPGRREKMIWLNGGIVRERSAAKPPFFSFSHQPAWAGAREIFPNVFPPTHPCRNGAPSDSQTQPKSRDVIGKKPEIVRTLRQLEAESRTLENQKGAAFLIDLPPPLLTMLTINIAFSGRTAEPSAILQSTSTPIQATFNTLTSQRPTTKTS
ncbi:hypothetical protein KSP40_PGU007674 [Platanthera guangdongensis]|uniref:Uncharacterized protein n=1 Tax=Platanthera guangdongensis TaxID=2320717 RepID=A0ABR2MFY3_9ASPA